MAPSVGTWLYQLRNLRRLMRINFAKDHYIFKFIFMYIMGPPSKVFFQLVLISRMVALSSCLIWQIISFIFPPNEYGCVYDWTRLGSGSAIDLQKMPIWAKNSSFQMELILILAGRKIVAFGAQKTRTHTLKNQRT